jgi:hypothetical protein
MRFTSALSGGEKAMNFWKYSAGILSAAMAVSHVQAQSFHPQMDATHTFSIGAFFQDADTSVYAAADGKPGADIDLNDLGVEEDDTSWLLDYSYRLGENWLFSVGAYIFDVDGTRAISKDIDFNGVEFPVGSTVDTTFKVDTYIADVMYRVYGSERAEIFIGGGIHILDISTELATNSFIGDNTGSSSRSNEDLLAPLPNLRMQAFFAITPKWAVSGTLGWLSVDYDDYEGSFSYLRARTSYRITDRLDIGVGYQLIDIDFTNNRSSGEAGLDAEFNGPSLRMSYSF